MPTAGFINSTFMAIFINDVKVAYCTGAKMNVSSSERDVTNKDSAGWKQTIIGLKSGSFNVSGLVAFDATLGVAQLFAHMENREEVTIKFTTDVTGDTFFTASCYVTSLDVDSDGAEENVTYQATLSANGAITIGTTA